MNKDKIKVCIIGGGNISNSRHIPALKKLKNVEIVGVMSRSETSLRKTQNKNHFKNEMIINNPKNDIETLSKCDWFKDVQAVVIGVPPKQHYPLAKMCLQLGKNVLVEKPMMMNKDECEELIKLSKQKHLKFCVMHNFQFANGMLKLNEIIKSKKYGEIVTITEMQFTNRERRLPVWYNDLPLGLFYDEAAHFIYLLQKHCGKVNIDSAYAKYNSNDATPALLSVSAQAGKIPVQMLLNMNSPICEWYYIVSFKKEMFIYDFFKDILVRVHTDNEHLGRDIIHNDFAFTFKYWFEFIKNGFKLVTGNLLYGHDIALGRFIDSIITNKDDDCISAENGEETVITMNEIIKKVNK
jgi:scyllo-inositol 2-dehydrogenase (NADP+)